MKVKFCSKTGLFLIFCFITTLSAGYKTGGNYEIITDVVTSGGETEISGGGYINNTSLIFPATFYDISGSTEVVSGYLQNINNLPLVTLTTPYNEVWLNYKEILLSWSYFDYDNDNQVKYKVDISTSADFTGEDYGSGEVFSSSTEYTTVPLPDATYYWRVRVCDDNWYEWSVSSYSCIFRIDTTSPTVDVSWDVYITSITIYCSASDAGVGLDNECFRFHISTSAGFELNLTTTTLWVSLSSWTFTNLTYNTTYYFKVEARDKFYHTTTVVQPRVTLCNYPKLAENPWQDITDVSITVAWALDEEPRNPDNVIYKVDVSSDVNFSVVYSSVGIKADQRLTVSGLTPNTTYYARVVAYNWEGLPISTQLPDWRATRCSVPGEIDFISVSSYSITLTWEQNNNPTYSIFEVEVSTTVDNQYSYLWSGATNTLTHTGLQPNTTYYFRVRAKNLEGFYTEYNEAKSTTTKPQEVFGLYAQEVTASTILWVWTAVDGAVSYNIYSTTTSERIAEVFAPSTSWEQVGLLPNTSYTIQVSAVNMYGQEGVRSVAVSTYTLSEALPVDLLDPTTWTMKVQINPGNNQEHVEYAIKFCYEENSQEITKYVQGNFGNYYLGDEPVYRTTTTWSTIVVNGLAENVQYRVSVLAKNEVGRVNESIPQGKYTLLNPPTYFMFVGIYYTSITVSVPLPPNYNSGETGCEFVLTTGTHAGGSPSGKLTRVYTYTDDYLQENTRYGYKVRYYNGDNVPTVLSPEDWRYTLVLPPSTFTIIATSTGSLRLQTNKFPNDTESSSGYLFEPNPPDQPGANSSGWIKSNIYEDGGLLPNTTYTYIVRFKNGSAIETQPISAVGCTFAQQPTPPNIIEITSTSLKITFGTKENPYWTEYSIKVLSYGTTYYLKSDYTLGDTEIFQSTSVWGSPITIGGLTPNVEYRISVQARNLQGYVSSYSLPTTTRTYAETPGKPDIIEVTSGSIKIVIDPRNNSAETTYLIKCIVENTTKYVQQDGTLGNSSTTYLTYDQWGGTVNVVGLYAGTIYEFFVQAKNGYGHLTEFSLGTSTVTLGTAELCSVDVSTYSLTIKIVPHGLSPNTLYAIKDIISQTTYYIWPEGSLRTEVEGSSWTTISGWGGTDVATIIVSSTIITPNQKHDFYLGIKSATGETLYDFNIWLSTYTLAEEPEISLFNVFSDSVSIIINPKNNPDYTEYAVRCIVDGTTYYLQQDHTLSDISVWQTSSAWSSNGVCYVIVSTPNFPVEVEVKSRNMLGVESVYSNRVSTWTALVVPDTPTVIGCYDPERINKYFTRIFINSRNSKYTEYAIKIGPGGEYYLKTDGSGAWDTNTKHWATKEYWHNNRNVNHINTANQYFGPDEKYSYAVIARSISRQEETLLSGYAQAKTPFSLLQINVQEVNNDMINISWTQIDNLTGITRYDIYKDGNYIGSVSTSTLNYYDDIDGGTPQQPTNIKTKVLGNSVIISWDAVQAPAVSPSYSYKVIAVAEVQGSTYTIIASPQSQQISVSPVIKSYIVYCLETNTTYYISDTTITISGLAVNTTYNFYISALSSDDLESIKVSTSVYLFYLLEELKATNISMQGVKHNGLFIGVPEKPNISIEFNKVIDTNTVNVYLKAVRDNKNNKLDEIIQQLNVEIYYTDNRSLLSIVPQLNYGYRYQLIISSVSDLNNNIFSGIYEFETLYDFNIENKIVPNTTTYIEITNDVSTLDKKVYLKFEEDVQSQEIYSANKKLSYDKKVLKPVRISIYDENNIEIKEFNKFLDIMIGYNDDDNDGYIDGIEPKIKIDTLSIWYLDEERRVWMKLPSTIDKVKKVVSAKVRHLSIFALIGAMNYSVADVRVYPVPWIPEDGKQITGTLQDGITFINLPVEGEILIYTITGELVRKIEFKNPPNGEISWDGKNQDGNDVSSGVYLWIVKSPKDKKTGKLIVIR